MIMNSLDGSTEESYDKGRGRGTSIQNEEAIVLLVGSGLEPCVSITHT
jgi:hypothetical protein